MTPERRNVNRWQIGRQVKIKLEGAMTFALCQLKDINLKGVQISLPLKLPKDAFVRLSLVLADDFILNVEVWVAWHKTIDGHNLYGLYFTKIQDSDREKIYRFLRRDFAQQLDERWRQGIKEGGETMIDSKFADRRVFERFAVRVPVRFLDLNVNKEYTAFTQDISAKGVGLVTQETLPEHTPLEIWLEIPDKGEPLYTRGEVTWSKCTVPHECRAGINLEKADLMGLSRVLRMAQ